MLLAESAVKIKMKVDNTDLKKGLQETKTLAVKTNKELNAEALKLAAQYRKTGMDSSEAMKKAHADVRAEAKRAFMAAGGSAEEWERQVKQSSQKAGRHIKEFGDDVDKHTGKIAALGGAVGGVFASLTSSAIGALSNLASEAIVASDALQKFDSTMEFAGFGTAEIDAAREAVKAYADETVYDLEDVANTTAQLAANGVKDYTELTQAAGNLNAVAGGNADTFKSVAMVLTQTAGAGKLTTENWNQLADAIPGASGQLQEALLKNGAYVGNFRDAMAAGEITAEEFNQALMDLGMSDAAIEAASSAATIEGAVGNLEATVVTGIMNIIDAFGKEKLTGAISLLGDTLGIIFDAIAAVVGFIGDHIEVFTAMAVAIGLIVAATYAQTAAQWALNAAMEANPIGIVIVAIVALVSAILLLYDKSEKFRNFVNTVFGEVKEIALELWDSIKGVLEEAKPLIEATWEFIKQVFSVALDFIIWLFGNAWDGIKVIWDYVEPYFYMLMEGIRITVAWLAENLPIFFENAWNAIKAVWDFVEPYFMLIWNNIETIFSVVAAVLGGDFGAAWDAIKEWWNNAVKYFADIWEGIKNVFINVVSYFGDKFQAAFNKVKEWFTLENFKTVFHDSIIGGLESIIEDVGNAAKKVWEEIKKWLSEKIGITLGFGGGDVGGGDFGVAGSLSPFNAGRISSNYGWRTNPVTHKRQFHNGVDIAARGGTPIQSTTAGVVSAVLYEKNGFGNYVIVRDPQGNLHYYAHMSKTAATPGQMVFRGSRIGYVGTTGRSTGNHLHYGVRGGGGNWINPWAWLSYARGYATGGFPAAGEIFIGNENGIEMMGKMGKRNVVANNMQIIDGIRAGIYSGLLKLQQQSGGRTNNNNVNLTQNFFKENVSPSDTKRAARRGIREALAGGQA